MEKIRTSKDTVFSLLSRDTFRQVLKGKNLRDVIDSILEFFRDMMDVDYSCITIWDTEKNIPYFYNYKSSDGTIIPPAKPGKSPLGICMVRGEPIRGRFADYPGGDRILAGKVGEILCIPLDLPETHLVGAIGVGRRKGKKGFDDWVDANLKVAGAVVSAFLGVKILEDLLNRERRIRSNLQELVDVLVRLTGREKRYKALLEYLSDMFDADFLWLGRVREEKRVVTPVATLGLEEKHDVPFEKGLVGIVAQEKRIRLFTEYPEDRIPEGYEKRVPEIGSAIVTPIFVDGRQEYVLAVVRKKGKKQFDNQDFYFFHVFQKILNVVFSLQRREEERERLSRIRMRVERLDSIATLAGGVAHDFNNIISIIMGYAQMGMEMATKPEERDFFNAILKQCRYASNLTSQILLLSQEKTGKGEVVDLRVLLKGIVKLIERTFPSNIRVVYEDEGRKGYTVIGDPTRLHNAFLNLAANAKDAMPDGGTLTFRLRIASKEEVERFGMESAVVVEVEDTGCGIPEEIVDKVFDPFFTTKAPGKGTGLGLAQVHKTVMEMNGFIDVVSEKGMGTKFIIYLPKDESTEQEVEEESQETLDRFTGRVLLVEDNIALLDVLKEMLSKLGFEVFAFGDPLEAETFFEKEPVDLLITDLVLPKMSGLDLAKRLKEKRTDLFVLFMTGYSDRIMEVKDFLKEHPRSEFLLKPFTLSQLSEALKRLKISD